jgi:hypothetical protein
MGKKISNQTHRATKKPRRPRRLTPAGRRRMAKAGAANLYAYKASVVALRANARESVDARLDAFERELIADLGGYPSAAERALIESAKASYAVVSLALTQLRLAPGRLARARGLSATIAAHQNSLLRALKALGIKRRGPEGPTLESVFAEIEKENADGPKR